MDFFQILFPVAGIKTYVLIPPAVAGQLVQFLRLSRTTDRIDWLGVGWVTAEIARHAKYLWRQRGPLPRRVLREFRELGRTSRPIELKAKTEGMSA